VVGFGIFPSLPVTVIMKKPIYNPEWPESWKSSYAFDLMEMFGERKVLGHTYAYQRRLHQSIAAVSKYVPPGSHLIDVAAAQGNFSLSLAERGYRVTWNDLREDLIGYVQLKYEAGDIEYRPGNCFELNQTHPYDAVLITEIIEHVAHPDQFLRNISTLVKPGGHIILTTPNGEYFKNNLPRFSDCPDPSQFEALQFKPDADGHIFLLHRDEMKDLVAKAGLMLKELNLFTNPLTNGHLKMEYVLRLLPKRFVDVLESVTSSQQGKFFPQINIHTLAVLQKPMF
jgi:2-polyprenyl-6-hydroxyphenyl methylase/3-demethylubiquinone-9 3-methyltransferase